jgi:hypothetical protein
MLSPLNQNHKVVKIKALPSPSISLKKGRLLWEEGDVVELEDLLAATLPHSSATTLSIASHREMCL